MRMIQPGLRCLMLVLVLVGCFGMSGCATMITLSMPPEYTVEPGLKSLGPPSSRDFTIKRSGDRFHVWQTPVCREKESKRKIGKKRQRGIIMAIIETPLFGLGILDWVMSYTVAESSREVETLPPAPTGEVHPCGPPKPASDLQLVIQVAGEEGQGTLRTGKDGSFALYGILGPSTGELYVNLFVTEKNGQRYLTTLWW